jgi:coatomer subunit beta'
VDLLIACGRLPEAAFFARTYCPSKVTEIVGLWQSDLITINPKAAESLANPDEYPNLFPGWQEALEKEMALGGKDSPSGVVEMLGRDLGGLSLQKEALETGYGSRSNEVYEEPEGEEDVFEEDAEPEEEEEPEPEVEEEAAAAAEEEETFAPVEEEEPMAPEPEEKEEDVFDEPGDVQEEDDEDIEEENDVLELTAEEEKLLEEELDGDIDLDDDWGLDDDDDEFVDKDD